MYLIFLTLSIIFSSLLFSQQSFKDFKRQQEQAFSQYKESVTKEYDAYEVAEKAAYEKFKENMERQWEEFKGSSAKIYVSYDEDLQSRASIDYENGHLLIEVIIDEETADIEGINYYKDFILPNKKYKLIEENNQETLNALHYVKELSEKVERLEGGR